MGCSLTSSMRIHCVAFFFGKIKKWYKMKKEETYRSMSKKELAAYYGVSISTLKKWLKPIENRLSNRKGRIYSPRDVKIIREYLG